MSMVMTTYPKAAAIKAMLTAFTKNITPIINGLIYMLLMRLAAVKNRLEITRKHSDWLKVV